MKSIYLISFWIIVPGFLLSSFGQQWQSQTIDPNLRRATIVQIGDINGDKYNDVVATSSTAGEVVWYENNPSTKEWDLPYTIDDNLAGAWGVQIVDIDNDSLMDVVAAGREAKEVVWYKNEGGTPIQWTKFIIGRNVFVHAVCVTDIDGDKDQDVIAAGIDGDRILLYENNGLTWVKHTIGYSDGAVCLESYDMDGDNDPDLVATSLLEYKVYWFENDPPNRSWYRHKIDKFLPGAWGLGVADIDNDGDPDVAATSLTRDDVIWYENNLPDLSWTKHIVDANLDGARYLRTTDLDLDSHPDLVVTGYDADAVVWYKNDLPEDTAWTRNTIDGNPDGANYVSAGDLNGDAYPDLVMTAWFENRVVWYNNLVVGIEPLSGTMPTKYVFSQNYPNPFNPTTTIKFSIPQSDFVTLKIYNMLGEEVATLVSERLGAGEYKREWDAGNLASGMYMYRIQTGDYVESKKMVLLR